MRTTLRRYAVLGVLVLALSACARSGTVSGDILAASGGEPALPSARAPVVVIPRTAAFEEEWDSLVARARQALGPALSRARAAARAAEAARQAWDSAVASHGGSGVGMDHWNRSSAGRHWERELWGRVRRASREASGARQDFDRLLQGEAERAATFLRQRAAHEVLADERGHYLIPGVRPGRSYLFCRLAVGSKELLWLHPFSAKPGLQRVDLSEINRTPWPFAGP